MKRFANVDVPGSGKNARRILKDLAGKALVDQAAELNVVVGEEGGAGEEHEESRAQQCDSERVTSRNPARSEFEIG